ncbi:MAG: gliding motility-associated C-terminal domain-containing protein [Chitinophagales bacterium]|jgi:gliding motility-associated-like protein
MKYFLVIVFLVNQVWMQAQPFTKVFTRGNDLLNYLVLEEYPDNGWIAAGSTRTGNSISALISRFDALGNIIWTKSTGYRRDPRAIVTLGNGDLLFFNNNVDINQYFDASVLHLGSDGSFKNEVVWGAPEDQDDWFDARKTQDGGAIAVGMSRLSSDIIQRILVVRFAASGQVVWEKMYDVPELLVFNKVVPIPTGGFFLLGDTYDFADRGVLIVRCDENGDILWSKEYDRTSVYENILDGIYLGNDELLLATYVSDTLISGQINLTRLHFNGMIISQTTVTNSQGMAPIGLGWLGNDTIALAAVSNPVLFPPVDGDLILATFSSDIQLIGGIAFGSDLQDFGFSAIFRGGEAIFCGLTDSSTTGTAQRAFISKANPRYSCCRKSVQLDQLPIIDVPMLLDYPIGLTQNTVKQLINDFMSEVQLVETVSCKSFEETNFLPRDTFICVGGSIELRPEYTIPGSYLWNTGEVSPSITVTEPGEYSIQIINECGLIRDTILVRSGGTIPLISVSSDTAFCLGSNILLTASGGSRYTWMGPSGIPLSETNELLTAPDSSTVVYVIVTTGDCSDTASVSLTVLAPPIVQAEFQDTLVPQGSGLLLSAFGAVSYEWEPSTGLSCSACSNPSLIADENSVYVVTGINSEGCEGKDTVFINVKKPCLVYVPTVFAPSEDSSSGNELFKVYGTEIQSEGFLLQVYSRWGELVFQTQDPAEYWDGQFRGRPASPGVYVYQVEMNACDEIIRKIGDVTLVR